MSLPDDTPLGRLSRVLAAAAPPKAVVEALAGEPPQVAAGQLWRARRGKRTLLVLISWADGVFVEATPATIDEVSDADAVDLPAAASTLSAPLTVWLGLTCRLPTRTLEQYTGKVTLDGSGPSILTVVAKAGRTGEAAVSPADPKVVFRAGMIDTLNELAAAPLPHGSGELPSILKAAHLPVSELCAVLGMNNATVLALHRGQRTLDPEQAARLAPRIGRSPDELLQANPTPPAALVEWMSHPAQRRKVVALARKKNVDEDTAFSHATFATFALAARTAGDRDADSAWAALGQRYFESVLDAT